MFCNLESDESPFPAHPELICRRLFFRSYTSQLLARKRQVAYRSNAISCSERHPVPLDSRNYVSPNVFRIPRAMKSPCSSPCEASPVHLLLRWPAPTVERPLSELIGPSGWNSSAKYFHS